MKAIILGSSGLTGSLLLNQVLNDERYSEVVLISRKGSGVQHPKVTEHIVNLFNLDQCGDLFKADHIFCCIGTTKKKTPDRSQYRKIDFGIPVNAAKLAKQNGISSFAVISSIGADASSSIFYSKTKGEMENGVLSAGIPNTVIVRPSFITGQRKEQRTLEKIGIILFKAFQFILVGPFRRYRAIEANDIAFSMIFLTNNPSDQQIFESNELETISKKNR